MNEMEDFNTQIIEEFRANHGRVAAFGDAPMVILHTTGAKSGRERETPLVAQVEGDNLIVFGSKAGATTHPDWYHNLVAHPEVTVEYGDDSFAAPAVVTRGDDRETRPTPQIEVMPQFADYIESAGNRKIPVISLQRG